MDLTKEATSKWSLPFDMHVVIRQADGNDLELIQHFGTKTFRDSFEKFNTPENMKLYLEKSFSTEQIRNELSEPGTEFHLAFIGQQIVGYTKMRLNKKIEGLEVDAALEIERIYVDREFHGKQVGKLLLDKCIQIARSNGMKAVCMGVWEHNPRAAAFYRKWGFEKFSTHVFMLGDDAQNDWLMAKKL